MTHDIHGAHGVVDPTEQPLPVSAGVTFGFKLILIGGFLASLMQGIFVLRASPFGRVWPAADVAKVQLPPMNLSTTSGQ